MSTTGAGWQSDPTGRHELRWFDGAGWTDQVADGGVTATDPMGPVAPVAPVANAADPAAPAPQSGRKVPLVVAAVVVVALGAVAFAVLGGGDDGLSDDELSDLAEEALDDVDLPNGGDLDIGDEAFSFECAAEVAGLDEDEVVVELVGPVAGEEQDDGFAQVSVAIVVLRDAANGQRLVDAFGDDEIDECIIEAADLEDDFELDFDEDELDVDGATARRFEFEGGAHEAFLPVGRLLVDVQAFADDDDRRDELLLGVLEDVQESLREGGA